MVGDAGLMTTRSPLVIDDANSSNSIYIKQMKYSRLIKVMHSRINDGFPFVLFENL